MDEPIVTPEVINPPVVKRTTIINNINPYKNPVTTILGGLISLLGLLVILFPLAIAFDTKVAIPPTASLVPVWTGWALFAVGISLLLIPDKLAGGLGALITKKSNEL